MSCGETISFDLIKPILVSWEAYGQPPCLPLVYSTRSCRWQRADTGMTCATRSRRSLRSTAWSRGWDLRLTTSRSRYGGVHRAEKHCFLPRPSGIINHHVGNFWASWGKSKKSSLRLKIRSPAYKQETDSGQTNSHWSVRQRYSLEAIKWDSERGMIDLGIQDTCRQRNFQVRKCEEECCIYAQIQYEKEAEKRHRTNEGYPSL